nr:hypothetical protein [Luteibacter rhizovicinus]
MSDQGRPPIKRNNYFTGESLLTADFTCEQQYNMEMLALVNSSLHTWGIASGLEVSWQASQANQVRITAGMAIDRLGRQIVLTEPQVVRVEGTGDNAFVYLVIRYHEVYSDLTDDSGVMGYKRVVQQPLLTCTPTLRDPGIDIVLAVVNLTSQDAVNALTFKQGRHERRYVGSRLGMVDLVTEGAGIDGSAAVSVAALPGVRLRAKREDSGLDDYLSVETARAQFDGMLATRGNVGVGVDQPQANLQVERIVTEGVGSITTKGRLLRFEHAIHPPLRPGDLVIPTLPAGAAVLTPQQAVIGGATSDPAQFQMVQAFQQDLLVPARFSYVRATLVSFSATGTVGELLNIGIDGSVGMGVRAGAQTGATGVSALTITPDRRVGIALNGDAVPRVTLDVNGDVMAGALTCSDAVVAKSFEGNGSKLRNLPILSYWTKQDPSSPYSGIYYDTGNVGVQMRDTPASLSVGTGQSFIGSGLVSAMPSDSNSGIKGADGVAYVTLTGTQTAFVDEVQVGDAIRLGELLKQYRQVRTVVSNEQLELTEQFPSIVRASSFKYLPAGSAGLPGAAQLVQTAAPTPPDGNDGSGTISSSGTTLTGVKTAFLTELREGDWILIPEFRPSTMEGYQDQWLVSKVTDDRTLVVIDSTGHGVPANVSAFLVAPALLAVMQSNSVASDKPPPPAMLVANNRQDMSKDSEKAPNTVAINVPFSKLDARYALQVDGKVSFQGSGSFDDLTAKTVTVTNWIKIAGAGDGGNVLTAGSTLGPPLLTVTQTNVVVGAGKGASPLEVGGDAHATGNIVSDKELQGVSATLSGTVTSKALAATSMNVGGVQVDDKGGVTLFGARQPITFTKNQASGIAATDGFIQATIGTFSSDFSANFAGLVSCTVQNGATVTGVTYASANTTKEVIKTKKGTNTYYLPLFGNICMPVRKGEQWTLVYLAETIFKPAADIVAFWMPLGPGLTQAPLPAAPTGPDLAEVARQFEVLRQRALSGSLVPPASLEAIQKAIDQRVGDLARVLGDATGMPPDEEARTAFVRQLGALACSAALPVPDGHRVDQPRIDGVIDTFATLTGRAFTPAQRAMLEEAIRALESVNDSDEARHDAKTISDNIRLFLRTLQEVTGLTFDATRMRLLTRALARLVGNGSQEPVQEQ